MPCRQFLHLKSQRNACPCLLDAGETQPNTIQCRPLPDHNNPTAHLNSDLWLPFVETAGSSTDTKRCWGRYSSLLAAYESGQVYSNPNSQWRSLIFKCTTQGNAVVCTACLMSCLREVHFSMCTSDRVH